MVLARKTGPYELYQDRQGRYWFFHSGRLVACDSSSTAHEQFLVSAELWRMRRGRSRQSRRWARTGRPVSR